MDSLQLSELETFFTPTKSELNSKALFVDTVGCAQLDLLDPILERGLDFKDFMPPSTAISLDNQQAQHVPTHIPSNHLHTEQQQQSLTQVVMDATTVVHDDKYPGDCSILPSTMLNFLETSQTSPGGQSDVSSFYSEDSNSTAPALHDFNQHISPATVDAPSTSSFQWPNFSQLKQEDFTQRTDDYPITSCQVSTNQHHSSVSSSIGIEGTSFPYVTSPTTSLPSPSSTIYSASSPGTPGPSTPSGRGRRPNSSTAPYPTKSRRRMAEKGSQEYVDKRARNNVAVRKSRAKAKAKQHETEGRVKNLLDLNDQLQKKVDLLTKELNVLKSLFSNIGASIPDEFLKLIQDS